MPPGKADSSGYVENPPHSSAFYTRCPMINITDKKDCCGCSACVQACPKQCIQMKDDEEGFGYPHVDTAACTRCGACLRACPMGHNSAAQKPLKIYASKNLNEDIRNQSSSGGIFTPLAENVIRHNGVVFGAAFDECWNAVHTFAENSEGLAAFRGSKYMQSDIGTSYRQVKTFLNSGREVLFSGTPCQIAGLRQFLGKEYDNLFLVEILCHGVPSPKVWQRYLDTKKQACHCNEISRINFRDKKNGWKRFCITIEFKNGTTYQSPHRKDSYYRSFQKNLSLRPSCYGCKYKNGRAGSDLTIADYWNIDQALPGYNDDKGVSLVLVNTGKGASLLRSIPPGIDYAETGYEECVSGNDGFSEALPVHGDREKFFKELASGFPAETNLWGNIKRRITTLLRKL